MNLTENELYRQDLDHLIDLELPWEKLKDSSVLITGATGLIGSCFVDAIMTKNIRDSLGCNICIITRDISKASVRFGHFLDSKKIDIREHDINEPLQPSGNEHVDYIIHLASNTHPLAYASDPIGTITVNVIGTRNILEYACASGSPRVVFASSNEIYGNNRGDVELFDEGYCGYIDPNTLRAGYPESKRCGEALCQAYIRQRNVDIVIPRFTRSYGPTMLATDTKAISQFIKKAVNNEDIVLKSAGDQYYSYTYVIDAVAGLLTVMLKGQCGDAYNIADERSDITLKELAEMIADIRGKKVIYEMPDENEAKGYSTASKARLDGSKLKKLGWNAHYGIREGIERTISILL